jgi:ABC-type multidrug transport system fused ATPase/permease subunit
MAPAGKRAAPRLVARLFRHPALLAGGILAALVAAAAQLALTWQVKLWSDALLSGAAESALAARLAAVAALVAVLLAGVFLARFWLARLELALQQELREEAQAAILAAELGAIERAPAGEWQSRLWNDGALLAGFVPDLVRRGAGGVAVALGALGAMLAIDARLTLAVAIALPPVALLFVVAGRRVRASARDAQAELAHATSVAGEQLRGLATIRASQTEELERSRFAASGERYRRRALRAELWASALVAGVWLVTAAGLVVAVAWGSGRVATGERTPGDLLAFALFAVQAIEPLRRLSDFQGRYQRAVAAAERLFELIDLPAEPVAPEPLRIPPGPPAPAGAALTLEEVAFAWDGVAPVLRGVTFALAPCDSVALVAASGGGKSTLVRLLLGFERPAAGTIRLDGRDLATLDRRVLRREVAVAFQEPLVFHGTLAENLAYGAGAVPRTRLLDVAEQVGLEELLATLPGSLEGRLVEAGRSLSGGERQRIALARAVLRAPRLLLLDEATSAVDGETEEKIAERLAPFFRGRTVLVAAHRFATVKRLPRALHLAGGRIAGDGRPEELLASAAFRELFAGQVESP